MSDKNPYKRFTTEDIQRYIKGVMMSKETVDFEEAMSRDSFLKDAVDGYSGHSAIQANHRLSLLKKTYSDKNSSAFNWRLPLSVAASLMLLFGVWYFAMPLFQESSTTASDDKDLQQSEQLADNPLDMKNLQAQLSTQDSINEDLSENSTDLTSEDISNSRKRNLNTRKKRYSSFPNIDGIPIINGDEKKSTEIDLSGFRVITGLVLDEQKKPLRGAAVNFPNGKIAATTDFKGEFSIEVPNTENDVRITYDNHIALNEKLIRGKYDYNWTLNAVTETIPMAGSEVSANTESAAQAFKQVDKIQKQLVLKSDQIEPKGGFKKYSRYIKRNKTMPNAARKQKIEGDVMVQFDVLPDGRLNNFQVIESLGYGCDQEAIRLLAQGVLWETKLDNIVSTTFTISFP